ncbi:UDP-glucose 4-epimerase GalE [bacterium 210820-DFI.6.52]|uniref:UDP-glucose 4-epimerase n=1 Tax=Bittarella massiliensis (ex Durand et al. 2017) TaxID=1720313 RepID=A0AAQ1RVR4_9FIRM|nr:MULTISPECIES: UDP-glucose 4-epimerase GalE [Eubacteriales]MCB5940204.1 UDP-glucose 4-epimerase GalE [bacterium 210820-DFI.6.52]MZL70657.1 UDP-glucose 4-epimerase GalE [Bittarella massiliensis (ex Durand et al. 2017)]MZL81345.1 UDP-glucose 4-epimerase GalE [Bittarella massiliensis (ex Durand et al. 2017)]SHG05038.1 UDP-galactose 4-epimerase [Bittarella massiliensis (ex Durand et al. 2017)]
MKLLITGGAGYIGSHTCVELLNAGHEVVILDNLCNSSPKVVERIQEITGKPVTFCQVDLLDYAATEAVFRAHQFDGVIHFAGLKAVGESVEKPLEYYHNNLTGTLHLLKLMQKYQVFTLVFSSSATVYGSPATVPITEDFPLSVTNPYGATKLMTEEILRDLYRADPRFSLVILRYFNPIGAHESGRIGENPKGIPNNLIPYITQVAVGKLQYLNVYGENYPTVDGTGVRDYIHVVDLAKGHIKAVEKLAGKAGVHIYNLGTGNGYSVLQVVDAFEKASGQKVPYKIAPPRAGDIAECWADASKAKAELGWEAEYDIQRMCVDSWRWQSQNPNGYDD